MLEPNGTFTCYHKTKKVMCLDLYSLIVVCRGCLTGSIRLHVQGNTETRPARKHVPLSGGKKMPPQ